MSERFAEHGFYSLAPQMTSQRGPGIGLGQHVGVHFHSVLRLRLIPLDSLELNASPFRKPFYGLWKRQAFAHLNESQHVAADPAGKTLEYLLGRVDVHTGPVIRMKWTVVVHFEIYAGRDSG